MGLINYENNSKNIKTIFNFNKNDIKKASKISNETEVNNNIMKNSEKKFNICFGWFT